MLQRSGLRAYNLIEMCRPSALLSKQLVPEKRCYHRSGIFDEDNNDGSYENSHDRNRRPFFRKSFQNRNNQRFDDNRRMNFRNQNFYPNQRSRNNHDFGQELTQVTFNQNELEHIETNLYVEHPNISQRSDAETESYRESVNMKISGTNVPRPILNFEELNLPENLKELVLNQGFSEPTAIQSQGWPIVMSGRDMVGISQTGSGKTLVFMIPGVIHALNQPSFKTRQNECSPQVLIMAPTRELVQQISQVSEPLCEATNLITACAYGGASRNVQLNNLRGAHICVATPGRLIDFVSGGLVSLRKCSFLVLDEADRMLDMGFEPQIRKIMGQIRPDRQTLMWSATWPKEIQSLAEDFLQDYVKVTIGAGQLVANPKIQQNIYVMKEFEKNSRLESLLEEIVRNSGEGSKKVLVFAQTKRTVDYLGEKLRNFGYKAFVLHGDISQTRRDFVLNEFRRRDCILIATDVAARGLDVSDIHHVVNFDFPLNIEDYIHRIGRTARGVSSGFSHSFFTAENAGVAAELITVLEQAGQTVNPELHSFVDYRRRPSNNKGYNTRRPSQGFQKPRFDYAF